MERNVLCVKWGDKFQSEHVNRLYKMAKKNISLPFNFYCWTEDSTGIDKEIKIVSLDKNLDLKKWWWKLTLFKKNELKGINLFLDLDVVIQNNIDHLFKYATKNKLTLIDRTIHPLLEKTYESKLSDHNKMTTTNWNSSIMIWNANENEDLYKKFIKNINFYTKFYAGIDRFFTYEISNSKFVGIKSKEYYMRTFSDDYNDNVEKIKINGKIYTLFYNESKNICIFNGCHEEFFYKGMEKYLL